MSAPDDVQDPLALALFTETARKAGVCWVTAPVGAARAALAWHVWHEDALLLLSGPGEQQLPGLEDGGIAAVALRSADTGGLLVRRHCRVRAVPATDPSWDGCAAALLAGRLNHGPAVETLAQWRRSAAFFRLEPVP